MSSKILLRIASNLKFGGLFGAFLGILMIVYAVNLDVATYIEGVGWQVDQFALTKQNLIYLAGLVFTPLCATGYLFGVLIGAIQIAASDLKAPESSA